MTMKPGETIPEGFVESLTLSQVRELMQQLDSWSLPAGTTIVEKLEELAHSRPAIASSEDTFVYSVGDDDATVRVTVEGDVGKLKRVLHEEGKELTSEDALAVVSALLDKAIQSVSDARMDIKHLMDNLDPA